MPETMDLPPPIQSNLIPTNESATVESANFKATSLNAAGMAGQPTPQNIHQGIHQSVRPEGSCNQRKIILTCDVSEGSDTIVSQQVVSSQPTILNEGAVKTVTPFNLATPKQAPSVSGNWQYFGASVNQDLQQAENQADDVVEKIDSGQLWVVNSRRRNGLIVVREFHAEFAGPGAAVGGSLDENVVKVIPIGNLSLLEPDSHEAHQNAIKIRLQWIRLTQNFTDQPEPNDRARMILEQFKTYFDQATVDLVPDEAFAMLVGVLPQTIRRVRSGFVW
ncbi:MAG: hypothetical protein ACFB0D_11910 [Phormidesmis sp.]